MRPFKSRGGGEGRTRPVHGPDPPIRNQKVLRPWSYWRGRNRVHEFSRLHADRGRRYHVADDWRHEQAGAGARTAAGRRRNFLRIYREDRAKQYRD